MCVCMPAYIYMFTCLYVCMCVCACISVFACVLVCVVCRIHFKQLLYPPNTHTGAVECAWTVMEEKAMQLLFSGLVSKRSPRTGTSHSPISKKMDDFFLFFSFSISFYFLVFAISRSCPDFILYNNWCLHCGGAITFLQQLWPYKMLPHPQASLAKHTQLQKLATTHLYLKAI